MGQSQQEKRNTGVRACALGPLALGPLLIDDVTCSELDPEENRTDFLPPRAIITHDFLILTE